VKPVRILAAALLLVASTDALGGEAPAVNYVSVDAVYVNVGRLAGVTIGARIAVLRDGRQIATLEAVHVSSHSTSCKVVERTEEPKAGDRVTFKPVDVPTPQQPVVERTPATTAPSRSTPRTGNRIRGYLSLQHMWVKDQSGSDQGSSLQPAVAARFVVSDLLGTRARLYVRYRSRMTYRPESGLRTSSHRLTECALRYGVPDQGAAFGVGRMVVDEVHGLGYIDGAMFSIQVSPHYRVGAVAGLEPDPVDMRVQTGSRKFGSFVNWQGGSFQSSRLGLTAALSGSYVDGLVDREFGYLQAVYSYSGKLHLYQSVEVDVNRDWRMAANGSRLSFSNFLFSANANPMSFVSLDFSYDARKNFHDYDTFETPDSLFDDNTYSGYGGGMTLSPLRNLQLRGNAGVRFRGANEETNRYYTLSATARHLPLPGHFFSVRWSVSETPFVTAYRPTVTHRFPVGRKLRLKVGAGAYRYEQAGLTSDSWFAEGGAYYTLGKRYYLSGDFRQYTGDGVDSFQLFTELGLNI
jgi:hypothetical protein